MGFCEILTIVFIVLKLIGAISWSWWIVLLPEIASIFLIILFLIGAIKLEKKDSLWRWRS